MLVVCPEIAAAEPIGWLDRKSTELGDTLENVTSEQSTSAEGVLLERQENVAIIRLGQPRERIVILSKQRMESLTRAIDALSTEKGIEGLVIIGAHFELFCAGADINVIQSVTDPAIGKRLAEDGQRIFQKIEDLPFRTVAAISGACVGGGCELVLSCDHRVLSSAANTRIGLPEIKLGILPGFGGTQRLPRLIGLPRSLDLMLQGKLLSAKKARAAGLADTVVDTSDCEGRPDAAYLKLLEAAIEIASGKKTVQRNKPRLLESLLTNTGIGRSIVEKKTRQAVQKTTGGNYPAPARLIDAVFEGYRQGITRGYEIEAQALGDMIVTPESKSLVHIFFLGQEAEKLGRDAKADVQQVTIGVLGAGTMGAGIAASFVAAGRPVVLVDPTEAAREKARKRTEDLLGYSSSLSDSKRKQLLSQLILAESPERLAGCGVVIEAIIEDLKVKQDVLSNIAKHVGPECIIASNTSSLSVTDIAKGVPHPERVVGLHFFNPVERMMLVEIVSGDETGNRAIVSAAALIALLKKYPVVVRDVSGFLVNRILSPYLVESSHLLAEGYGIEAIDKAALKFGMPMGPLRLLDEVGLDIAAKVADVMYEQYGDRMKGPNYAAKLVQHGFKGKKSGAGFYRYDGKKKTVNHEVMKLLDLAALNGHGQGKKDFLESRLILPMLNEAVRCLDEGVAGDPGKQACGQIDLATVMGIGFAPFRGGLMHYASSVGAGQLLTKLNEFEKAHGDRYTPAPGIVSRAELGVGFDSAV